VRPGRHHLESLDAFRGLTIAGMILVNNPGTWDAVYAPLVHSDWNGWTLADLVYPFFMVILGVALPFALSRRQQSGQDVWRLHVRIVRRTVLLFALGFALSLVAAQFAWPVVRIPGVLQRIALVYFVAALITLHANRGRGVIACGLLVLHWVILSSGSLTQGHTLELAIDRAMFGRHLLLPTGDPEGLLGTLSAVVSALIGTYAGDWLRNAPEDRHVTRRLFGAGAVLTVAGWAFSFIIPINKPLWTPSYAVFTGGLAFIALAACYYTIDVADVRGWARPFVWLGINPLAIYFLAELVGHILELTTLKTTLYWGLLHQLTRSRMSEHATSLLFAVITVAVWTAVAGLMYRRGVRIQV